MKIKLSYFLGKRGISLKNLCERDGIKSYQALEAFLLENRVECPPESEIGHVFHKKKSAAKSPTLATQPLPKKLKAKTKSSRKESRKIVTHEG